MLSVLLENESMAIIISIILGLGLASLFRQVCKGNECIIVKGPNIKKFLRKFTK